MTRYEQSQRSARAELDHAKSNVLDFLEEKARERRLLGAPNEDELREKYPALDGNPSFLGDRVAKRASSGALDFQKRED